MKHFTKPVMYGMGRIGHTHIKAFEYPEFELKSLSPLPGILLVDQARSVDFELKTLSAIPLSRLEWQLPANTELSYLEGNCPNIISESLQTIPANSRCILRLTLKAGAGCGIYGSFSLRCRGRFLKYRWDNIYPGARFHLKAR